MISDYKLYNVIVSVLHNDMLAKTIMFIHIRYNMNYTLRVS